MALNGKALEALEELLKDSFNASSLEQFVRYRMDVDMYKEWVSPNAAFKLVVFNLLKALESEGRTAKFLDELILEREDLKPKLTEFRDALNVAAIKSGVENVASKMEMASVHSIVEQSRDVLTELTAKIDLLRTYKALHDALHTAKMQFRSLESAARQMASDPMATCDFGQSVTGMETLATSMADIIGDFPAEPPAIRQDELEWLTRFTAAVGIGRDAADAGEHVAARQGVQGVRTVLKTEPSRIDGRLSRTAKEIDLTQLKNIFAQAAAVPELAAEAAVFDQGRAATEQLQQQIKSHISQHASWQAIDRSLAGADDIMRMFTKDEPWDFDALWKGLKEGVNALIAAETQAEWAKKLASVITRVDTTRAASDWPKLPVDFGRFRQEATVQFYVVDTKLKGLATEVNTIGAPLRQLLDQL